MMLSGGLPTSCEKITNYIIVVFLLFFFFRFKAKHHKEQQCMQSFSGTQGQLLDLDAPLPQLSFNINFFDLMCLSDIDTQ